MSLGPWTESGFLTVQWLPLEWVLERNELEPWSPSALSLLALLLKGCLLLCKNNGLNVSCLCHSCSASQSSFVLLCTSLFIHLALSSGKGSLKQFLTSDTMDCFADDPYSKIIYIPKSFWRKPLKKSWQSRIGPKSLFLNHLPSYRGSPRKQTWPSCGLRCNVLKLQEKHEAMGSWGLCRLTAVT